MFCCLCSVSTGERLRCCCLFVAHCRQLLFRLWGRSDSAPDKGFVAGRRSYRSLGTWCIKVFLHLEHCQSVYDFGLFHTCCTFWLLSTACAPSRRSMQSSHSFCLARGFSPYFLITWLNSRCGFCFLHCLLIQVHKPRARFP